MGVPILKSLKMKHLETLHHWVDTNHKTEVFYPDITAEIVDRLLQEAPIG